MKKLFLFIAVLGMLSLGASKVVMAQDEEATDTLTEAVTDTLAVDSAEVTIDEEVVADEPEEGSVLHKAIKRKFIEGGASFMGAVLLTLIFGLALCIERIIYLNLATTNTSKLLKQLEDAIESDGVDSAKEICRNTRGPVASIFFQGLDRSDQGVEAVEKTIIAYGGVQMGLLEKGLNWISLFISIAPMLGFMGTVIGMMQAFESIRIAGDVNASLVAGPIGVALITTVSGLIVAVVLQIFYNYILSKIDAIVNNMEDASISLVDIMIKHNLKNK